MIDEYCVGCHSGAVRSGGLALDELDTAHVATQAEPWERVIRKLRAGTMPPAGNPRPEKAVYRAAAETIEAELDRAAARHPYAGQPLLHRLNRAEYANAIRDVLGLEIDAPAILPPDDAAYGFDNVSEALGLSPALQMALPTPEPPRLPLL